MYTSYGDNENRVTYFSYGDPDNPFHPTSRMDDNGAITNYLYNDQGDLKEVEDTYDRVTKYTYAEDIDPQPIPDKHRHLIRKIERPSVTVDGVPQTYQPTEIQYDADGNVSSVIDAKGQTMSFGYSADGLLLSTTDRRGHTSEMIYEGTAFDGSYRRLLEIRIPKGLVSADGFRSVTFDYQDADNPLNVTSVQNDLGHTVFIEYDIMDRVVKTTDARGNVTEHEYIDGLLKYTTSPPNSGSDGNSRTTEIFYDSLFNVEEIRSDISLTERQTRVQYERNVFSEVVRLIRVKDTVENAFSFERDALGRVIESLDTLQRSSEVYWEDACTGRSETSARGLRRLFGVDLLCRTTEIQVGSPDPYYSLSLEDLYEQREFDFDELGRMIESRQIRSYPYGTAVLGIDQYNDNVETKQFLYDELDRLVQVTFNDGSTMLYEYDADNNVTKVTDPEGKVTRYEYFRDNLLHKVVIERGGQDIGVFVYSYDAAGRLDEIQYPSSTGITAIFRDLADTPGSGFDENGNIRHLRYMKDGTTELRRFEWRYDDSNNRESMLDVSPGKAVKWEWTVDWLDRLVTVRRAEATSESALPVASLSTLDPLYLQREYVFDESDNRTFFDDHVNGLTYHYRYASIDDGGTTRYSDQLEEILVYPSAAGHRVVGDFTSFETFEHDADGNMTKRTIASTSEEISYKWTEFDRLKRVESDTNGRMQDARYNVEGLRERKLDKNGNSSVEHGLGIMTSASKPGTSFSNAPSISYISGHMILGAEIDGEFVFHLGDALSSVRDVVDDTGAVIKSFEFDEYGNLLSFSGTGTTSPKTWIGGLSVNDDRADSGMFNMGHRNYSAGVLGRFISRDPIGHAGNLNLYNYTANPVNYTDPEGLAPVYTDNPTGALPPGWTMTVQPDGVHAYSNQDIQLRANTNICRQKPVPPPPPPSRSTPDFGPLRSPVPVGPTGGVSSSVVPSRPQSYPVNDPAFTSALKEDIVSGFKTRRRLQGAGGEAQLIDAVRLTNWDPNNTSTSAFRFGAIGCSLRIPEEELLDTTSNPYFKLTPSDMYWLRRGYIHGQKTVRSGLTPADL